MERTFENRARIVGLVVLLLAVVGGVLLLTLVQRRPPPENVLRASGRIEGFETALAPKIGGRIAYIAEREGALVRRGALLIVVSDQQRHDQLAQAQARARSAGESADQSAATLDVLAHQVAQAQLGQQQAALDAAARVAQARAQLASAQMQVAQGQAEIETARAQLALSRSDHERAARLVASGDISRQVFERAQAADDSAAATLRVRQAALAAAHRQVEAAGAALALARSTELTPDIRAAQVAELEERVRQARLATASARSAAAAARAERDAAASTVRDLRIYSPLDGIVLARSAEPGAIVAAGAPVLTILDPRSVYLRAFIPAGDIARVRVGERAEVILDGAPSEPLAAHVAAIDAQAAFTPENVYFQSDRVRQVFGVRIAIDEPRGAAKPGMPADARIALSGDTR
jgi:HlyD family secretion protein